MEMTDTEHKLNDAATQMLIAHKNSNDERIMRSCINSFISHARSITFVMQVESSSYKTLEEWYLKEMGILKKNPLLKFFNEQRVHSIHRGVIKPIKHSAPISDFHINGVKQPDGAIAHAWVFTEIEKFIPNSSGNVFRLCEEYFIILKKLVSEWLILRKNMHNEKGI